jgi:dihydromethanopterin reductase (acceptor)
MKILWCITGGGYLLEESCKAIQAMAKEHEVTIAFSNAGKEVVSMYGYSKLIEKLSDRFIREEEQGYSSPMVCRLGRFDLIVVSPCTANTVAKIVHGIADSLVTNIVAQALKSKRKVIVVPTDTKIDVETVIPSGKRIMIRCRDIDLENVEKIKSIEGVIVIKTPDEVKKLF